MDAEVNNLDIKISLLVKNRVSLEEVAMLTKKKAKLVGNTNVVSDSNSFSLKGNDKETRAKLQYYGQLFYLIQTQPEYLAKLMFYMNKSSGSSVTKFLENVVLALYGYAQNSREEFLFLNLIKVSYKLRL